MRTIAILGLLLGVLLPVGAGGEVAKSLDGEISGLRVLKLLYGELSDDNGKAREPAVWRNVKVPDELKDFSDETTADVYVAFEAAYSEDGTQKYIVITQARPSGSDFGCHACAPLIGGAIFAKTGNRWVLEVETKYIDLIGKYGLAEPMELVEIGPQKHGILVRADDMNQGYESRFVVLIGSLDGELGGLFVDGFEGPGEGACPDGESKTGQGIDIAFIDNPKSRFRDIRVMKRMNTGECGRVKSVTRTETYVFRNGQYVKSGSK